MPKQLQNVKSEGDDVTITVVHSNNSEDIVPAAPGGMYGYASGDTFVAAGGVSFDLEFDNGAGGAGSITVVSVDGAGPATITIPNPAFFDAIEDYYDENGNRGQTLVIGDDAISIRG